MLYRAPVGFLKSGNLSKRYGHLVVVMRLYPRFTPKELIDEYVRDLAPDGVLFPEFRARARALKDHNRAFEEVDYEARFRLEPAGLEHLRRLTELSRTKDVYLLCQCSHEERCHCDLLLLTARARFEALTSQLPFAYPVFEKRLAQGELELT